MDSVEVGTEVVDPNGFGGAVVQIDGPWATVEYANGDIDEWNVNALETATI